MKRHLVELDEEILKELKVLKAELGLKRISDVVESLLHKTHKTLKRPKSEIHKTHKTLKRPRVEMKRIPDESWTNEDFGKDELPILPNGKIDEKKLKEEGEEHERFWKGL